MTPTPSPDPRRLRVLVAEDNPVNQRLVRAFLEQRGHLPVIATDGREAVAWVERESFDVVLMDLEMRGMNGVDAVTAIRARERSTGARVPIVAVTAHDGPEERQRCLAAGMDGYLTKPVGYDRLIAVVEGSVAPAGETASPGASREISALFLADAARLCAEIHDAVARLDGVRVAGAAHQLRGSAGYFTAERVWELAKRLEELGRAGDFSAGVDEACADLTLELARLDLTSQVRDKGRTRDS